jgi:hypothetical protein
MLAASYAALSQWSIEHNISCLNYITHTIHRHTPTQPCFCEETGVFKEKALSGNEFTGDSCSIQGQITSISKYSLFRFAIPSMQESL